MDNDCKRIVNQNFDYLDDRIDRNVDIVNENFKKLQSDIRSLNNELTDIKNGLLIGTGFLLSGILAYLYIKEKYEGKEKDD